MKEKSLTMKESKYLSYAKGYLDGNMDMARVANNALKLLHCPGCKCKVGK